MGRAAQRPADPELEQYLGKVGKDAKARRDLMGLSQEASARQAGIPIGALRDIEQGYDTRIGHHCLNAKHLGQPFGYGFSDDVAQELKAIRSVLSHLGERMDRLGQGLEQLAATLTGPPSRPPATSEEPIEEDELARGPEEVQGA